MEELFEMFPATCLPYSVDWVPVETPKSVNQQKQYEIQPRDCIHSEASLVHKVQSWIYLHRSEWIITTYSWMTWHSFYHAYNQRFKKQCCPYLYHWMVLIRAILPYKINQSSYNTFLAKQSILQCKWFPQYTPGNMHIIVFSSGTTWLFYIFRVSIWAGIWHGSIPSYQLTHLML